jgi:hypothetical protein
VGRAEGVSMLPVVLTLQLLLIHSQPLQAAITLVIIIIINIIIIRISRKPLEATSVSPVSSLSVFHFNLSRNKRFVKNLSSELSNNHSYCCYY